MVEYACIQSEQDVQFRFPREVSLRKGAHIVMYRIEIDATDSHVSGTAIRIPVRWVPIGCYGLTRNEMFREAACDIITTAWQALEASIR